MLLFILKNIVKYSKYSKDDFHILNEEKNNKIKNETRSNHKKQMDKVKKIIRDGLGTDTSIVYNSISINVIHLKDRK